MTVAELIRELQHFDAQQMVYVPDTTDATVQLVAKVQAMPHVNVPEGIAIPDDVILLPLSMTDEA